MKYLPVLFFYPTFAAMRTHSATIRCLSLLFFMLTASTSSLFAQSQSEWTDKAYSYLAQDSLAQAETCFIEAIKATPASKQSAMLLTNLGTVQRRRGKMQEAITTYTQALERSPLDAPILMERATAYMAIGNDDKAYTDLCNVLDKDATHTEALYYRAFIYTHRREYSLARTDYKRLLAANPFHDHGLFGLALLDQREGRLQAAEQQLSQLIDRNPDNATYWQARANVLIEQKLYELALIDLETAITLQPTDPYIYVTRAELHLKMKHRTAARSDLDHAAALGLPRAALSEMYEQCK